MEEIYKKKTKVVDSPIEGIDKIIWELFAVYDEEVKKITNIDKFGSRTSYEFNFNGSPEEAMLYIGLFASALGYTGDVWKNVKYIENDYTIDYPEYDFSLTFNDGKDVYTIYTNPETKKIDISFSSEKLKENHEYLDEVIINTYAEYLRFIEDRSRR